MYMGIIFAILFVERTVYYELCLFGGSRSKEEKRVGMIFLRNFCIFLHRVVVCFGECLHSVVQNIAERKVENGNFSSV